LPFRPNISIKKHLRFVWYILWKKRASLAYEITPCIFHSSCEDVISFLEQGNTKDAIFLLNMHKKSLEDIKSDIDKNFY
jgi:hypothetical protein